jgi:hypothetical protein
LRAFSFNPYPACSVRAAVVSFCRFPSPLSPMKDGNLLDLRATIGHFLEYDREPHPRASARNLLYRPAVSPSPSIISLSYFPLHGNFDVKNENVQQTPVLAHNSVALPDSFAEDHVWRLFIHRTGHNRVQLRPQRPDGCWVEVRSAEAVAQPMVAATPERA